MTEGLEHLYYHDKKSIASSLYRPLYLSPIRENDPDDIVQRKLNLVGRFLETYIVYRYVSHRSISHSYINYPIYNLIKKIRDKNIEDLSEILKAELISSEESLDNILDFNMHGRNKSFVHFLLSRITDFLENKSGNPGPSFDKYMNIEDSQSFQVEHILGNNFMDYPEFEQRDNFQEYRNKLGALLLLPEGFNQSYSDSNYKDKLPEYLKKNVLAQTLHPDFYEKNPGFKKFIEKNNLPFKPYNKFGKQEIEERTVLIKKICEEIYSLEGFNDIADK